MKEDSVLPVPTATTPVQQNQTCVLNKDFTYRYLPAIYGLVFVIGFLANAYGLWNLHTYVKSKRWSSVNILVFNLGVADLLYVITLPFWVAYYANKAKWLFGNTFCKLTRFLFHLNLYGSIGFLMCISVQRYLLIVYPMKSRGKLRTRHLIIVSVMVWIWVIVQIAPDLFFVKNKGDVTKCYDTTSTENLSAFLPYSFTIAVTGFFIPFVIILGCYSHVAMVLVKNGTANQELKDKCLKLIVIVTVLFFVCFFPYHILRNTNLISRTWPSQENCTTSKAIYFFYQITRGLVCLNSAINPLVYLVTNEGIATKLQSFRK
uniref:Si:dkey-78k11.9 n=2 Tax=Latimeria chalumnae TaxID=7897 RepID=H2ZXW4_LATCH